MKDVQKTEPVYKLPVFRVGIQNLKLPIKLLQKEDNGVQHTVADVDCFVDLDRNAKGTHMSRISSGLQKFIDDQLSSKQLEIIAEYIRVKCEAKTCELVYKFPYFLVKKAPVSKQFGIVHYNTCFKIVKTETTSVFSFNVEITSTSLCPCSKEISEGGAHNQRSKILITCIPKQRHWVWIEDIIDIAEKASSCQIYSVLKREDEKYVTDEAYNNPKFVEDMVREIYYAMEYLNDIEHFDIQVANEESIHIHNAYARMYKGEEIYKHI